MDSKPPIDFDRLKAIQEERRKKAEPIVSKPHPSLTDPYYYRQLISLYDFDES